MNINEMVARGNYYYELDVIDNCHQSLNLVISRSRESYAKAHGSILPSGLVCKIFFYAMQRGLLSYETIFPWRMDMFSVNIFSSPFLSAEVITGVKLNLVIKEI